MHVIANNWYFGGVPAIQFNARLPHTVAHRFKSEAMRHRLTAQELLRIVIQEWFDSFTVSERARHYDTAARRRKTTGAPLSVPPPARRTRKPTT